MRSRRPRVNTKVRVHTGHPSGVADADSSAPLEVTIARLSPNLVFRVLVGAAQLGALYLATHTVGTAVGWTVMTDAAPRESREAEEDEDEDEDDAKAKDDKSKESAFIKRTPDSRETKLSRYNAFCPTCAPPEDPDVARPAPDAAALADMEFPDAVRTQLPLALVATMEAEDPGISLATISHSEGGAGVYAEGEEVLANVTLLSVDLGLVYLRTATRVEYLPLSSGDVPPPKAKDKPDEKKKKEPTKSKYSIDGAADAIKCTKNSNGHTCTVERKFINQLIGNPAVLATQARAQPYDKRGFQGFRLSRVRKGTIPYLLGIRSGNVITAINGQDLKSLDGAMALYAKLRSASHLSVDYVQGKKGGRELYEKRVEIDII